MKFLKILKWVLIGFFSSTVLVVLAYRWLPVEVTPLMVIRCAQQMQRGESPRLLHRWVPLDSMSVYMPVAVMASEDQNFLHHHGFDVNAIADAAKERINGGRRRGGSTISQQTAKNVFLWPGRSWTRKGFEVYFTALIELLWSKQRIMEVYLNSIEMGNGIYGADAVAEYNFGKQAIDLSRSDCATIAATLPNPRELSSKHPGPYVMRRRRQILANMRYIPSFPKPGEDYDPHTASGGVYAH